MIKGILKTVAVIGFGYVCYKLGHSIGSFNSDPVCQSIYKDFKEGKIDFAEYISKINTRKTELNA